MAKEYGTIVLWIDGEYVSLKGDVTLNLSGGEKTFTSNMDGSLDTEFSRQPITMELSGISGTQVPIETVLGYFKQCATDGEVTDVLLLLSGACSTDQDRYNFKDARFGGAIQLNARTGEISGVVIAASEVMLNGKVI